MTETKRSRGRPKGSRNKRSMFSEEITQDAVKKLEAAVSQGEQWAIVEVLKRTMPPLKPVTPEHSIDAKLIEARIFELTELEKRLEALENESKGNY